MRSHNISRRLTFEDAAEIWRRRLLGDAQHDIAAAFRVNQGRISEVLSGKKFSKAKPKAPGTMTS